MLDHELERAAGVPKSTDPSGVMYLLDNITALRDGTESGRGSRESPCHSLRLRSLAVLVALLLLSAAYFLLSR